MSLQQEAEAYLGTFQVIHRLALKLSVQEIVRNTGSHSKILLSEEQGVCNGKVQSTSKQT